jgi:hypothetical protein
MDRKEYIEEEITKTLKCLDQIERIEGSPFFYAHLQAKIRSLENQRENAVFKIFNTNTLRPAFLTLIVVLNLVFLTLVFQQGAYQSENQEEYISVLSVLASEYGLDESNSDFFNAKQ